LKVVDAGAHQRGSLGRRQFGRHPRHSSGGGDHVLSVAAVDRDPGGLAAHAGEELAAAAVITIAAIAAVPPYTNALTWLPSGGVGPDRVDHTRHLVAGNTRVLNTRK
jgi:hypothetical protein